MDDNGHVQSITDYHTRSISDSDFTIREQQHGYLGDDNAITTTTTTTAQGTGFEIGNVGVGFRQISSNRLERRHLSGSLSDSMQYTGGRSYQRDEEKLEGGDRYERRHGGDDDEKTEELDYDYEGTDFDDDGGGGGGGGGIGTDDDIEKARRRWKVQVNSGSPTLEGSRTRRSWSEPVVTQRNQTSQEGYNNGQRSPPSYRPHPRQHVQAQQQQQQQHQRITLTPPRLPQPVLQRLHSGDDADDSSSKGLLYLHHANNNTNRYPTPDDYRVQRSKQDWNQSNIDNWREKYREEEIR